MARTRQQARREAHRDESKARTGSSIQKNRATRPQQNKKPLKKLNLSSLILDLLDRSASDEDFRTLLAGRKDLLSFTPPLAFDNIYAQDAFYYAIHKGRLDILPWMLQRQNLHNWNTLHLAVVYDSLDLVKKLGDRIPELGCVADDNGRTPLHLAFLKCNAQVARFLLEMGCWKNYQGDDRHCLGHKTVEALAFDHRKSGFDAWAHLVQWLYKEGGMEIDAINAEGHTALDLAREWDIYDPRVKYPLMGRE